MTGLIPIPILTSSVAMSIWLMLGAVWIKTCKICRGSRPKAERPFMGVVSQDDITRRAVSSRGPGEAAWP